MAATATPRPVHPYLALFVAAILPGVGHVMLGQQARGLGFAFFTVLLFHVLSIECIKVNGSKN